MACAEALAVLEDWAWRHMKDIALMVKAHIPAASRLRGRGTGRTAIAPLPAVGAHTWLLCTGKGKSCIEQEAEKHVSFCSKSKAYCLGYRM